MPKPTTEHPLLTLPTNAPYQVLFSQTSKYYWPDFDKNATETTLKKGVEVELEQGPFGFGNAVVLDNDRKEVMMQNKIKLLKCQN